MCLSLQLFIGLFFGFYFCVLFSFFTAAAFLPFWDIPDKWGTKQIKIWCVIAFILSEVSACYAASIHGSIAFLTAAITVIALTAWITFTLVLASESQSDQKT